MSRTFQLALLSLASISTISPIALAGPDLVCSEIGSAASFGSADGLVSYAFATTLCNVGDEPITWDANTNEHPIISQTLYKLSDGQITQIGIGHVRHMSFALEGNACGLGCTPAGSNMLGAGCSTTSAGTINGSQGLMGPRSEIESNDGFFPYPFDSINQIGDPVYKRLRATIADVSDQDALYFVETQVVTPGETTAASKANNASYRQVLFSPASATASLTGPTYSGQPAINAWRDHGLGINQPDTSVIITQATTPSGGIVHLGSKATLTGTIDDIEYYRYDYALHNLNEDQSIGRVLPAVFNALQLDELSFAAADHHDGLDELIRDEPWRFVGGHGNFGWRSEFDFKFDPLGNAVRWGTMYSFACEGPYKPTTGDTTIVLFEPSDLGEYGDLNIHSVTPGQLQICGGDVNGDGLVDFFDIAYFLDEYNARGSSADFTQDGLFDFFDISAFLDAFAQDCP
tara:strand:+ start:20440 stop:21819 length:1380 start_codon:yes stop_codon:yes gene_type:complete